MVVLPAEATLGLGPLGWPALSYSASVSPSVKWDPCEGGMRIHTGAGYGHLAQRVLTGARLGWSRARVSGWGGLSVSLCARLL